MNPMTSAEAYAFLFGHPPTPETLALLASRGRSDPIATLSDARRLAMALDRVDHPTTAHIRFTEADLHTVQLDGFAMTIDVADLAVSNHIVASGIWEPELTAVFRRYLRPGHHVADIGANVGYFTLLARSLVGPAGHVHAFEPNPENARLILLNLARNGFANVSLLPLALSDRPGHALFTAGIGSNGKLEGDRPHGLEGGASVVVPTMRLDDLMHGPLDFMKLDTEGAEYRILRGAQRILATHHPIVSTEFSCDMLAATSGVAPREFLSLFLAHGYAIHTLDPGTHGLVPVPGIDTYLQAWTAPDRVDTLILLPAGTPALQP